MGYFQRWMRTAFVACVAALASTSLASAQSLVIRTYTNIDSVRSNKFGLCKTIERGGTGDHPVLTERCPSGPSGWPVTMFSADARSHVLFGKQAKGGGSVPGALESAFADPHSVIEWRISNGRPFAAIHRYFLDDNSSVLIVHRLQPDRTSCVMAVVKPRAGHNANEEAIEIADRVAPNYDCGGSYRLIDGELIRVD